jgi:hypothetical protein
MEVFRDLYVSATTEKMNAAVAEMEKAIPAGWARDKAAESRTQAFPTSTQRVSYCFACKKEKQRSAAMLILAQKDPATFFVSNIIPVERHQLSHAEYNTILEDFYEKVFKPVADKAGLVHSFNGAEVGLEHWMDKATADLLRAFSACANKGTGASHPSDRERWNAFMLAAHRTGSRLDPSTLARWLVEVEEWSPEIAEQLALEYESGRGLLAYAFSH